MSGARARRGGLQPAVLLAVLGGLVLVSSGGAVRDDSVEAPSGLAARHVAGQTFLTWSEVNPTAVSEHATMAELSAAKHKTGSTQRIRYRLYRSTNPIRSVAGSTPIAEVPQMSAWNTDFYGWTDSGAAPAFRYVVEDGKDPLPPGTGVFVYNPPNAGRSYYAITAVVNGTESRVISPANTLAAPVAESVGQGVPVLQRIERPGSFKYANRPTLHFYVRWESPPNSSAPGRPFDYLVAIPDGVRSPAPAGLHLHCWGASLTSCSGWWFNAEKGAVHISSNQIPYDWWTGHHESIGTAHPPTTPVEWQGGVVRAYSQRRLLSFLDWAAGPFQLDLARTFAGGSSMGGTGALMLAIHHPDRIAWAIGWVGVHVPQSSPQFKSSFEAVYGKPEWGVKFENGTPVWDHFNSAWYLRQNPGRDVGFITFSNGKNDGGIGWGQAAEFYRALQETRQPHMFVWGQSGHGERAYMPANGGERVMPLDITVDRSLPAFTRSTLDDDPGDGTPTSGSPSGQVNRYLTWDTGSVVDEPDRWEVTVRVIDGARGDVGAVDITPRRLQRFKASAGDRIRWTNTSGPGRTPRQSGTVTPDRWGLVTLPQVEIGKAGNRIQLRRAP
jgi:pimeloyl-ACP methyl ester carboxylesterase